MLSVLLGHLGLDRSRYFSYRGCNCASALCISLIVPFPHLAILIAALQYAIRCLVRLYHPHPDPIYFVGDRIAEYYRYTGPALLASAVGGLLD
jgi:hypothetical protein